MIRVPFVKTGQVALLACSVVFAFIPTVFVMLRLIARRISKRRLDSADYTIIAAWVCGPLSSPEEGGQLRSGLFC